MTIKQPENLPTCKLISTLISKSSNKLDYAFNYIYELEQLRNRISVEVSQINIIFPEYTPHDEKNHLSRLFHVADQLLGEDLIEHMNATELFLLCVCLYGHDWGMAVSKKEQKYIVEGCIDEHIESEFATLVDEKNRFGEFCRSRSILSTEINELDWAEYVRITHAFRSGQRIKKYFEAVSPGVADYAARICEGHWLNFDVIDDYISYPTNAPIHLDTVNVKALTIYVRLIDLLDLGEDRTPYLLWKFVSPNNNFSKLEWAKHRALRPVTFPKYQSGRYIQVDGSTEDHNVYVAIMDLKNYIDDQFRQCSDILNRISHEYHKLDISHMDWRIAARGFEPTLIQFQFDRNRMFEILGDQIYKGNPYVFIRELLQNAVDAIKMRTELLSRNSLSFIPRIEISVVENEEKYIVNISDNGIGMDEYIVRNYLAVAGKSYYKSTDFIKEELNMDPISRFGIGVLSCFMVSDYIEIRTYRDPHTTKKHDHLKISIPSKENYFRIEKNIEDFPIGSRFTVHVDKKKLPLKENTEEPISLEVTKYLKMIAGFVPFNLHIIEQGIETLIDSPEATSTDFKREHRKDYTFPYEKAFHPQHVQTVKDYFVEKKYHLSNDLGLKNYNGCITFLLPIDENIDIVNIGRSWPIHEVRLIDYKAPENIAKKINWYNHWINFDRKAYQSTSKKNFLPENSFEVFMDGILLPDINPPILNKRKSNFATYYNNSVSESFVIPSFVVNIPKPEGMKIDLARTSIESKGRWDKPIWDAFFSVLKNSTTKDIEEKNLDQKLLHLARIITFYKISPTNILKKLLTSNFLPMPILSNSSNVSFKEIGPYSHKSVKVLSEGFSTDCSNMIKSHFLSTNSYKGVLNNWRGEDVIISQSDRDDLPSSIINSSHLIREFLVTNYFLGEIEFISSPSGSEYPIIQEVLFAIDEEVLQNHREKYSLHLLRKRLSIKYSKFPKLVIFPEPYSTKFLYSFSHINHNHPLTKLIIKISDFMADENQSQLAKEDFGKIRDLLNDIDFLDYGYYDKKLSFTDFNERINRLLSESYKFRIIEKYEKVEINSEHFVPNSVELFEDSFKIKSSSKHKNKKWGFPIVK